MKTHTKFALILILLLLSVPVFAERDVISPDASTSETADLASVETGEITVWGEGRGETDQVGPEVVLLPEDLKPVTAATTEDLVKYEPSVIIRRRFIGDANGTVGMRGSNMFQTARTMVFADGIPLHYFLQTRWSGAPRWGLVNAEEIGFVELVYGPFSAEYGGNAMGGVINIETKIPVARRLHFDGSVFQQTFDADGFDESLDGFKGFLSYGEKFDRLSLYAAYSRLQNDGHAQTFRFGADTAPTGAETSVTGALPGTNEYGDPVRYFGNSGIAESIADQFKIKLGYDFAPGWYGLFNVGYEVRDISNTPSNYLADAAGRPVWNGAVVQNGTAFNVRASNFATSDLDRSSLLLGGRLQGALNDRWFLEAGFSRFNVLEDETRASLRNPADPAFTPAGTVRDFDEASWQTGEVKVQNDRWLGSENLSLTTGYRYEHYELGVTNYNSDDFAAGLQTSLNNSSGGQSTLHAAFAQFAWQAGSWDVALGGRYEDWSTQDGFYNNRGALDLHVDRSEDRFSPKLSVGYTPNSQWRLRWSSAIAYRFPIVEELFQNERRTNGTSIADADLEPEDGLHHNLLIERYFTGGSARVNLFTEKIDDVIFNQRSIVDNRSISTFLPIDQVVTDGAELIVNHNALAANRLSMRWNVSYLDSEIRRNSANPALEGNVFPRMPEWRSHLLLNYRLTDRWDLGGGVRYASDSFGDLDNGDTADEVFGAHDAYTQVNLRAAFQINDSTRVSFAVDNLTDEIAYVHHPWPGRTAYVEFSVDWK